MTRNLKEKTTTSLLSQTKEGGHSGEGGSGDAGMSVVGADAKRCAAEPDRSASCQTMPQGQQG